LADHVPPWCLGGSDAGGGRCGDALERVPMEDSGDGCIDVADARALNLIPLTVWLHADEMLAKEYVKWDAGKKAYVPDHAVRQHALDWLHEEQKRIAGDPKREAFVVTRGGHFGLWVNPVKGYISDWQEDE
jgi:hypothetical protein